MTDEYVAESFKKWSKFNVIYTLKGQTESDSSVSFQLIASSISTLLVF